jgi:hypothetical protein
VVLASCAEFCVDQPVTGDSVIVGPALFSRVCNWTDYWLLRDFVQEF